jgi:hypothetical protein
MNEDLRTATLDAIQITRDICKSFVGRHCLRESAEHFISNIAAVRFSKRKEKS